MNLRKIGVILHVATATFPFINSRCHLYQSMPLVSVDAISNNNFLSFSTIQQILAPDPNFTLIQTKINSKRRN